MTVGKARGLMGRIGGPERMREILHRFYQQLFGDAIVGFFFHGQDIRKIVSGQHAFLMRAFQETERFTGIAGAGGARLRRVRCGVS